MKYLRPALLLLFLTLPFCAHAEIQITEVMYDPEGSDTDREWIEVYNAGASEVSLEGWKLFENDVSHGLDVVEGSAALASGEYAIIADDARSLLDEFPSLTSAVFDSAFTLNNTGESVELRDASGTTIDSVVYVTDSGADGTGASLQLQSDGETWIAGLSTPGEKNTDEPFEAEEEEEGEEVGDEFLDLESDWPFSSERIYIDIGGNQRVFVDEEVEFSADVRFKNGDSVRDASVTWAFGDGEGERGERESHSYSHPGLYRAIARVEYKGKLYQDAIRIQVLEKDAVALGRVLSNGVEIINSSDLEVDISNWMLEAEDEEKTIALGTHILPQQTIVVPLETLHSNVSLFDASGDRVALSRKAAEPLVRDESYEEIQRLLEMLLAFSSES